MAGVLGRGGKVKVGVREREGRGRLPPGLWDGGRP